MSQNACKRILVVMFLARKNESEPPQPLFFNEIRRLVNHYSGRNYSEGCMSLYLKQLIMSHQVGLRVHKAGPYYELTELGTREATREWTLCQNVPGYLDFQLKEGGPSLVSRSGHPSDDSAASAWLTERSLAFAEGHTHFSSPRGTNTDMTTP